MSKSGKKVCKKTFAPVSVCCSKKCCSNISESQQKEGFDLFWTNGDYGMQNMMLASMMTRKDTTNKTSDKPRILWFYTFRCQSGFYDVCRQFLCNLLQVDKSKFETIRLKLLNGESLTDKRGQHGNHRVKLTENVKKMIHEHCYSIPHSQSHYEHEKSNLLYFENPDLNMTKMYKLFVQYYTDQTGDTNAPIEESYYCKYFNHNVGFSFSTPRTDVCDYCLMAEKNSEMKNSEEFKRHKELFELYKELKKEMLISYDGVLCCEFDFGQNLALPKLPCSDQFYKRLLWLYVFNVHIHGPSQRSYMYTFMEGFVKKGSNSVSNMVLHAIEQEFQFDCYNKIHLFSDSCGGQNKNYALVKLLSLLARHLQVEIDHLYPVRGHSYNQCDRNFGMYGQKKKKVETIETPEEYFNLIESAKNPPFIIVKPEEIGIYEQLRNETANRMHCSEGVANQKSGAN